MRSSGRRGVLPPPLSRADGGTVFAYLAEYLADELAPAVATPPSATTVRSPADAFPPFFAGLLPEGRRLAALRQAVKTT